MYEPDIPKKVPLSTFNIQVLFSPKHAILEAFCVKKITQIIKIDFGQKKYGKPKQKYIYNTSL